MRRFWKILVMAALAIVVVGMPSSRAQPSGPDYRFRWIDEVEQQTGAEREGPLSRPAPVDESDATPQTAELSLSNTGGPDALSWISTTPNNEAT